MGSDTHGQAWTYPWIGSDASDWLESELVSFCAETTNLILLDRVHEVPMAESKLGEWEAVVRWKQ